MTADRGVLDRPAPGPDRMLRYGPVAHQVVDLYLPGGPPPAWVVLVHGGFWRAEWDRTHLRPLADALRGQRYGVALLEYARTGMAGGGWPGTFDDVAAALTAVREHATSSTPAAHGSAGSTGSAPPLVLVGHSAGGHLATWLLHQGVGAVPGRADIAGAVSLAGCLDLSMVADLGLDDGAAAALLGGDPTDVPDRYDAADPARLGRTPYPLVVVHGTADEQVPLAVAHSWWDVAATPGRDRLVVLDGVGHFALIDPASPAFALLTAQIGRLVTAR